MAYPASLDELTDGVPSDGTAAATALGDVTYQHDDHHRALGVAVEAVEAELGTDPSGSESTVKDRIAATETVANAAIPKALVDAKGDLVTATAADTPARLAVGTNGYVLTADSGEATGIKWAAAAAGGPDVLFANHTDVGNVGAGEDDLHTNTLAAGQLAADGDSIRFIYMCTGIPAKFPKVTVYFAGSAITAADPVEEDFLIVEGTLIRTSSTTVAYQANLAKNGFYYGGVLTGLTLSGTNVLKIAGENTVDTTNDAIVANASTITYFPA